MTFKEYTLLLNIINDFPECYNCGEAARGFCNGKFLCLNHVPGGYCGNTNAFDIEFSELLTK